MHASPPEPAVARKPAATIMAGARAAVGLPTVTIFFSLVGIGGLVRDIGWPMLAGVLSSVLMWAGPAQVLLFGSLAAGVSLPVIMLAVLLSSLRFLPMTMSIMPLLSSPRRPLWQLLLAAHLIAITNWIEGLRRLPALPESQRYSFFMGFGSAVMLSGAVATGCGYYMVAALPGVLGAALLFTTPIFFTASILAPLRTWPEAMPVIFAVVLAPFAPLLVGEDYALLLIGLGGGTLAWLVQRAVAKSAAPAEGGP
jgi:predicted branched-subunit amino acid permease